MRRSRPRFEHRFMLLSAVVHVAPVLGLPFAVGSCPELDPSPIPTEQPLGVSLVYIDELATSSLERVERAPLEGSTRDDSKRPANAARPTPRGVEPTPPEQPCESSPAERLAQTAPQARPAEPTKVRTTAYADGVPLLEHPRVVEWRQIEIDRTGLVTLAAPVPTQPRLADAPPLVTDSRDVWATEAIRSVRGRQRSQQDRERVIEMIKERIAKVMPLVYWNTARKGQVVAEARVRFRLDRKGYVHDVELLEVVGELEVDSPTRDVLHLAEPYVFVPGWIELDLLFRG